MLARASLLPPRVPVMRVPVPKAPRLLSALSFPPLRVGSGDSYSPACGAASEGRSVPSLSCPDSELGLSLPRFKGRKVILRPVIVLLLVLIEVIAAERLRPVWGVRRGGCRLAKTLRVSTGRSPEESTGREDPHRSRFRPLMN